jgi:Ca-activated chloride channel family protein
VAGRHQNSPTVERTRLRRAPIAVVLGTLALAVAGVGIGVGALEYVTRSGPTNAAASNACVTRPEINVVAAPQIAAAVSAVSTHWLATHPAISGACPTVIVHSTASATEAAALAKPGATLPDLWIADSSVWLTRLHHDAPNAPAGEVVYPSVASSPLVIATTAGHQTQLSQTATAGWQAALSSTSTTPMALVDPGTNTAGLLALLTVGSTADALPTALLDSLAHSGLSTVAAGLADLQAHPATARSFPASEQDVIRANVGSPDGSTPVAVAVYPTGRAIGLDFPVAQFSPAGSAGTQQDAAAALVSQLSKPFAQAQFVKAGLRDAAGTVPVDDVSALGASPQTVSALPSPSAATIAGVLAAWRGAAG